MKRLLLLTGLTIMIAPAVFPEQAFDGPLSGRPRSAAPRRDAPVWATELDSFFHKPGRDWLVTGASGSAFAADGKQVVVSRTNGSVEFFSLADLASRGIFDFSLAEGGELGAPGAISLSPDDSRFAVAFPAARRVLVVDRAKQRILGRIKLGFIPRSMRFSPRGRYLVIGGEPNEDRARAVYDLYHERFFLESGSPFVGDFSRDDRYFHLYEENGSGEGFLRWTDAVTRETLYRIPLARLGAAGGLLSLRSLPDNRIALGFAHGLVLADRNLERAVFSWFPARGPAIRSILTTLDRRHLIVGEGRRRVVVRLHDREAVTVNLPEGADSLAVYPAGNYLLWHDGRGARIQPLPLPSEV
jgi:hypothetical protein